MSTLITLKLTVDIALRPDLESLRDAHQRTLSSFALSVANAKVLHEVKFSGSTDCTVLEAIKLWDRQLADSRRLQNFLESACDGLKVAEAAIRERN